MSGPSIRPGLGGGEVSAEAELRLLRQYEPVIRYTRGELFLPCSVGDYVGQAALYREVGKGAERLAGPGTLDLGRLAGFGREYLGQPLFLRYVEQPLKGRAFRQWRKERQQAPFQPSSRFAAVGLLARLIDSAVRLTLVLRGTVPGGYAAAAAVRYRRSASYGQPRYYGRVVRDGGYAILQYWYFYAMNDWRSTFGGVNDHEADWEQVTIFLADHDGATTAPTWVAFSSHDEAGDDLRRRWDDPDVQKVGDTHPVVYAGAGSHSGAYLPGEYLVSVSPDLPAWLTRAWSAMTRLIPWSPRDRSGLALPYLDYRRGDGIRVGPGEGVEWAATLIDDTTAWVVDYRGLWGLDTRDRLGGERAPAGPRYERGQTVRPSWRQPVAWAGLDKQAPTDAEARAELARYREELRAEYRRMSRRLDRVRHRLRGARVTDRIAGRTSRQPSAAVVALESQVDDARRRQAETADRLEAIEAGLSGALSAEGVHDHLRHRTVPQGQRSRPAGPLLRLWAAISASVLLAAFGAIVAGAGEGILVPVVTVLVVMTLVEALLRHRLVQLVITVALFVLAISVAWAVVTLLIGRLKLGIGALLLLGALYMVWQTFREWIRIR